METRDAKDSKEARAERLAKSLRDNLRRRKAQARALEGADKTPPPSQAPAPPPNRPS